ncbi:MAG: hypothetical protein GXN98_02380 [Euryarchaeota archaeon]|nr:hypothetical protein [Euryarchaeota archaeon]
MYYREEPIQFIANQPIEANLTLPVEYVTGDYTIEVITLDSFVAEWIVKPAVRGTLWALGFSKPTREKIATAIGALVDCALAFTPWGTAISLIDLGINVVKMLWSGASVDNVAATVKGTASLGLSQLNDLADAKIAGKLSNPTKAGAHQGS